MKGPELVSLSRGAELADYSAETLKRWAKAGKIPCLHVETPRSVERIFRRADMLRLAAARQAKRAERA